MMANSPMPTSPHSELSHAGESKTESPETVVQVSTVCDYDIIYSVWQKNMFSYSEMTIVLGCRIVTWPGSDCIKF